jgi:AcrR family transcriptional regulator
MAEAVPTTRDRLLAVARELFTTDGYHAATTPVIAARAGVAEGTIYRHFPSKRALLNTAFQEVQQWGIAGIREALEMPGRTPDRLSWLAATWLAAAERDAPRILMLLSWRLPGELDDASQQATREFRAQLERLVAVGKQEGTIRAGVVELWTAVWLTLVAAAAERVATREWSARHPHALATIEAAWEAIAWRPTAVTSAPEA